MLQKGRYLGRLTRLVLGKSELVSWDPPVNLGQLQGAARSCLLHCCSQHSAAQLGQTHWAISLKHVLR